MLNLKLLEMVEKMIEKLNKNKIKKTIIMAFFVSLAGQMQLDVITEGFIVALSVLVMGIFIYCYEDLSPMYMAFCSGIFSPLVRFFILIFSKEDLLHGAFLAIPDMAFFFSYGIIYTVIYKYIINGPKTLRNFPYVIFFCDFFSNIIELISRSILAVDSIITVRIVIYLVAVALIRTAIIQMILIALDAYSNLLIKEEHDEEYKRLIVQASVLESELHVMEKNAYEIEDIMKKAFDIYKAMGKINAPLDLRNAALEISENAHEIKGDYVNIVNVLKDGFVDEYNQSRISIKDITTIEKSNIISLIRKRNQSIEIHIRVKRNFYVNQHFKMMSVIRNLMINAAEAIGDKEGRINLLIGDYDADRYIITVRDNGGGIDTGNLEAIFFDGFSTKFDSKTGNIQRGFGLNLVKDYIENVFNGSVAVESEKGKFTQFNILLPKAQFQEVKDEILHN